MGAVAVQLTGHYSHVVFATLLGQLYRNWHRIDEYEAQ